MSKRLFAAGGALAIALAIAGCVWVPLLIMKLNTANDDLTQARRTAGESEAEFKAAKRNSNELRTSLRVDLANTKIERDQLQRDLRLIRDDLTDKLGEIQKLKEQVASRDDKTQSSAKAETEKGLASQGQETQTPDAAKSSGKAGVASTKPKVSNDKFADDSLFDDSGWTNLSVTAKQTSEKPIADNPADSTDAASTRPRVIDQSAPPARAEYATEYAAPGYEYVAPEYVVPEYAVPEYVVPLYPNSIWLPAQPSFGAPIYIFP